MSDVAIRVQGLGKQYRIGELQRYKALRDTLTDALYIPHRTVASIINRRRPNGRRPPSSDSIWALKDVFFEVKRGEVVGIIGGNGAGKSTLLKILSRITEPTEGYAEMQGRVGSLLEVGTGFHPELTGRENIYLNGAILGMRRREIDRKFDEMVAFAEVEKFIDTPVKRYSSGMYVRLAFAVAAHLEPDVLIVDEVLAVGDAEFQKKCLGKMGQVAQEGRTVLFVSHNMGAITRLCPRALWLENGALKNDGLATDVVGEYLSAGTQGNSEWVAPVDSSNGHAVRILSARILSLDNRPTSVVKFREQCKVEIGYEVNHVVSDLVTALRLTDSVGNIIWASWDTDNIGWNPNFAREPGRYLSTCIFPGDLLKPGLYYISIGSFRRNEPLEHHEGILAFEVSNVRHDLNPGRLGVVSPLLSWEIKRIDGEWPWNPS